VRICLLTRADLFPTHHGAAVKIVRTAQHLSRALAQPVFVVTDDRDAYLRFDGDAHEPVPYSPRSRAAQEWAPVPRMGRLAERLCLRLGYPAEELFMYRPLFDPAWWGRALSVGRAEHIDIFQAEFPGYGVPAALAARALSRLERRPVRSSIVQHNVEWDRLAEFGHDVRWIRRAERAALAAVDDIIAVSADDRDRMVRAGLSAADITVIPHGVDVEPLERARPDGIRDRYGIAADAPLLFFHGTLHYWPNTEAVRFISESLLPRLLDDRPDLRVLIAGQSPPRYYDHPAIAFAGPVDDLGAHIAAADLCLCPIDAGGGTRMKLLEYMAAGRPVVSSTKGAEGIAYTNNIELAIADGAPAFAAAIDRLLADPEAARALGLRGQGFARRYDWQAIARAYIATYEGDRRGTDWNDHLVADRASDATAALDAAGLQLQQPSKPLTLLLLINRGCNLRCSFCDLWDDPQRMTLEQTLPLLDDAAAIGTRTVVLTGGEPFLHKQLFEIVAAARDRGMGVNITTNGTLVERRWAALAESGVDSLSLSIDGLPDTHDRLRGKPGAFAETWAALERLVAWGGAGVNVYFTVNRDNLGELVPVWERVRALGAGFDFWPVNDAPDLYLRSAEDQARWREAVAHIARHDGAVGERAAYYDRALAYHDGDLGAVRCLGFIDQYGVRFDGTLLPCCVWEGEGLGVGNVFETPLKTLWTSEAVRGARERLLRDGCSVGCFNHSLYEFAVATGAPFEVEPSGRAAAR
jgi:MoaA/NifB/PqqE/SkfB family radical SAM enzyme/glycosyltransferase involved in cell wall biosynthesis